MEIYEGKSIFKGIAIGKIFYYQKGAQQVKREKVEDTAAEKARYEAASAKASEQLQALYEKAVKEVGEANAAVFEVHMMMLEDDDYVSSIVNMIETQNVNAEFAVATTGDNFAEMFSQMDDEYFKARAADVKDITERLISVLGEQETTGDIGDEPVIIVADDLAPSETVQMDKEKLLAFVTRHGSANSHTAILARTMNIPAVTGIKILPEWEGRMGAVDGFTGQFYVDPDEEILEELRQKQREQSEQEKELQKLKEQESITGDGRKISLYANIGKENDVLQALMNGAEGIGLFRTEFLYLEKMNYPTEQEQFQIYRYVAEMMAGRKVVIRTLDIGADKQAGYFGLEKEENPALGYRAIRICLERRDMFKTQLRAILRAAAYGNISIMLPMIVLVEEIRSSREILNQAEKELTEEGIAFGKVELGITVETPAAAMLSEEMAKEVDFFCIGTNDLTQYTLAADRQNHKLDTLYQSTHPAVLKMIKMIIENGHRAGIRVGICGELGADTAMTSQLIAMGIDELSVSPSRILPVRKAIMES